MAELPKPPHRRGKLSPPERARYEQQRNARWRHYGAIGQLRWALITVHYMDRLTTATDEAKRLAVEAEAAIERLINSLTVRKDPGK